MYLGKQYEGIRLTNIKDRVSIKESKEIRFGYKLGHHIAGDNNFCSLPGLVKNRQTGFFETSMH
jgi:hypothetical protein